MLVLYAVVAADQLERPVNGLAVAQGPHTCVLYEERASPPAVDRAEVARFARSLLALARGRTLLPLRYGTQVENAAELDALIASHDAAWRNRLEEVAGHVELIVHWDATPVPGRKTGETGRDYLLGRVQAQQQQRREADKIEAALYGLVTSFRLLDRGAEPRVACLVPEGRVGEFRQRLADRLPRATCTGPWPPFSFAEETT